MSAPAGISRRLLGAGLLSGSVLLPGCDEPVAPDPVAGVQFNLTPPSLMEGDTSSFRANAVDRRGSALPDVALQWHSTDTAVAMVDGSGLVTAERPGSVSIIARAGAHADTADLAVTAVLHTDCLTPGGTTHDGTITTDATWRRRDGPHRIPVRFELRRAHSDAPDPTLTIEAGTAVCFSTDAVLDLGETGGVIAVGTAQMPIHFLPATSGAWAINSGHPGFFDHRRPAELRHVHMRGGQVTLLGTVQLDSSSIRGGGPMVVAGPVRFADSLIEDVTVTMRDGVLTYERSVIRRGSLRLASFATSADARLLSGRIEDSPDVGFFMANNFRRFPRVVEYGSLRIVGSALYPANITAQAASLMLATQAQQDSLLGNARDTLIVWHATTSDVTIRPGLPWKVVHTTFASAPNYAYRVGVHGGATLHMEPGAVLIGGIHADGGSVRAIGTADAPVVIQDPHTRAWWWGLEGRSAFFRSDEARQSVIRHARLDGMLLTADGAHGLVIDSSLSVGGSVILRAPGSRITASRFERSDTTDAGAISLAAADVVVAGTTVLDSPRNGVVISAAGARLHNCHVEGSAAAGVLVEAGAGIRVNDCNLVRNGGPGVENRTAEEVDATLNWWGHADGATAGDGTAGAVRTVPYRTAPVVVPGDTLASRGSKGVTGRP